MDAECGLAHFPIGTEIVYKEAVPAPENGKARKPPVDYQATVSRLYTLGVMDSEGRESIMNLKALIDSRKGTNASSVCRFTKNDPNLHQ